MNKLALTLPGTGNTVNQPTELTAKGFTDLASFITPALEIIFYIATFVSFYYLLWGAISYILARGEKESLAKARARITYALIGLIVVFLSFIIIQYAASILPTKIPTGGLPF